ncbi:MAG TPA: hypothetical protein VM261_38380 [Kofleriaceae bacterium]|nr:hypothetical protein [Kofleriaceae bacterium]
MKAQARRITDAVKERAFATTEDKKTAVSGHVGALAEKLDGIERSGDMMEPGLEDQLLDRGVRMLRGLQRTLDDNSTEELIAKAEQRIAERPGLVIAGCLAVGFLAARLVRK